MVELKCDLDTVFNMSLILCISHFSYSGITAALYQQNS